MNIRLIFIFSIISSWIFLVNFVNGPAQIQGLDRTGSPLGGGAFCGECHGDNEFNAEMVIGLFNDAGQSVTEYKPGEEYLLRIDYNYSGSPGGFGVQAVAIDLNENSAGELSNGSQRTQIVNVSGVNFFEHDKLGLILPYEVSWEAPPKGTGQVVIYAGGIVANGDRGNSGDGAVLGKVDVQEEGTISTNDLEKISFKVKIFNNPVADQIQLKIEDETPTTYQLQLTDAIGKVVLKERTAQASTDQLINLNISQFQKGIYFLKIFDGKNFRTEKILKI